MKVRDVIQRLFARLTAPIAPIDRLFSSSRTDASPSGAPVPRLTAVRVERAPFYILASTYGHDQIVGEAIAYHLVWRNDASGSSPDATARDLRGDLTVESDGRPLLAEIRARWDDALPPSPMTPTRHLPTVDLDAGAECGMALILAFQDDRASYLFTNRSYEAPNLRLRAFRLDGYKLRLVVCVRGTNVDTSAEVVVTGGSLLGDEPTFRILDTTTDAPGRSTRLF